MPADVQATVAQCDGQQLEGPAELRGQGQAPGLGAEPAGPYQRGHARLFEACVQCARPGVQNKTPPKVQGSYAGKDKAEPAVDAARCPATRDLQKPVADSR